MKQLKSFVQQYWRLALLASILYGIHLMLLSTKLKALFTIPKPTPLYAYFILCGAGLFGFILYGILLFFVKMLYTKNLLFMSWFKWFILYFSVQFIFLLFTWPGIYKGDEFYVLKNAVNFLFSPAQTGLTSIFYMICLLFFPSLAMITLFQIFVISCIFAYIMKSLWAIYPTKKIFFLMIVFLLLPILDANLFTLRASLVGWIFLLIMVKIYLAFHHKSLPKIDLYLLPALTGLIIAWRSEYIYLLLFIPIALYLLKTISKKQSLQIFLCILLFFGFFQIPNKIANNGSNKYPISLVLNPLANLFTQDDLKGPSVYDDILTINELVDVKLLRKTASVRNISQYWNIEDTLPKEQLNRFMKAAFRIIFYNFDDFLNYRLQTFAYTNGYYADRINHPGGESVDSINRLIYAGVDYKEVFLLSKPLLGQSFREKVISLLSLRIYKQNAIKTHPLLVVFYNATPGLIAMILLFLYGILKKKRTHWILSLLISLQFIFIFLTAPAMFFMYYFCFYLSSSFFITLFLVEGSCVKTNT